MTDRPTRAPAPRPIRNVGGDPVPGLRGLPIAALLAVAGLVFVTILSVALFALTGPASAGAAPSRAPGASGDPGTGTGPGPGQPTPDPSVVITPPPQDRIQVRGTILFVRTGNIWAVTGETLTELSDKGTDSWPVWAPDGKRIYFTETRTEVAQAPYQGRFSKYTLYYPVLMSMAPDGSDRKQIYSSLYKLGGAPDREYFLQIGQPELSPDGKQFALVSDAPDPFVLHDSVTLSLLPVTGGKITNLGLKDTVGHNDPAWSPDGSQIAFSYNGRNGPIGAPRIGIYAPATTKLRLVGPARFANPDWSPDSRYLVVERTDGKGRDIEIIDSTTGAEVNRLTANGDSFAPSWSADGTQIAYLRIKGQAVDLRIMTLADDGTLKVVDDKAITSDGSIDANTAPAWYFPPELRPNLPSPSPTVVAPSSSSASPSGSTAP